MGVTDWITVLFKWVVIGVVAGAVIVIGINGGVPSAQSIPAVQFSVDQGGENAAPDVAVQTDSDGELGATPTPTPTPVETGQVRAIDAAEVEQLIVREINKRREDPLSAEGSLASEIKNVAKSYSETMAQQRRVGHEVGGTTALERISRADLEETCEVERTEKIGFFKGKQVELVGRVSLQGATQEDVAIAIVKAWAQGDESYKIQMENAETIGVGVTVAGDQAYVVALLCS